MLVKFCERQFNPLKGCRTLRFGTLEYYRNLSPSFNIADKDEGKDTHLIDYVSGAGTLAELRTQEFIRKSGIFGFGNDSGFTSITNCSVNMTFPNSYLWCCKYSQKRPTTQDGLSIDRKYNSNYILKNATTFAEHLAVTLYSNIKLDMFTEAAQKHIQNYNIGLNEIKLQAPHGFVRYVDEKTGRYGTHSTQLYDEDLPEFYRPAFVKTNRYRTDSEYRFLFTFLCPKTSVGLSVRSEPLDMEVQYLMDHIDSSKSRP